MKVRITNSGEAISTIVKEITEDQYIFLKDVTKELNDNGELYCSYLFVEPIKEK